MRAPAHNFISGRLAILALASAIAIPVGAQQSSDPGSQTPPAAQPDQTQQCGTVATALPGRESTATAKGPEGGVLGKDATLCPQEVGEEADRSYQ